MNRYRILSYKKENPQAYLYVIYTTWAAVLYRQIQTPAKGESLYIRYNMDTNITVLKKLTNNISLLAKKVKKLTKSMPRKSKLKLF